MTRIIELQRSHDFSYHSAAIAALHGDNISGFIPVAVNSSSCCIARTISRTTVRPCLPCTTCKSGADVPVLVGADFLPHTRHRKWNTTRTFAAPSINGANYTWGAAAANPLFTALPS